MLAGCNDGGSGRASGAVNGGAEQAVGGPTRDIVFVANGEGGTVTLIDAVSFEVLDELDVLPDGRDAALGEDDPLQALIGQRLVEAVGGNNFAQDLDVSPDGETLYVSRGHRGDVAAFDIATGEMLWKLPVNGIRADHMTISEDGRRLYVSALTAGMVLIIDVERQTVEDSFFTGQWPHDNVLSSDGKRLYNGSIGNIVVPPEVRDLVYAGELDLALEGLQELTRDSGVADLLEEPRKLLPGVDVLGFLLSEPYQLTVVDAESLEILRTFEFDRGIRPFVLTSDESRMFAQLSFLHGIVEFDLEAGEIVRMVDLPVDEGVSESDYDFEAPHHGLALSPDESLLCAAGRASDYVALVETAALEAVAVIGVGDAPGWAANSPDGRHCFVANTRSDDVSVISYAQRRETARLPAGNGPKYITSKRIPVAVACSRSLPAEQWRC